MRFGPRMSRYSGGSRRRARAAALARVAATGADAAAAASFRRSAPGRGATRLDRRQLESQPRPAAPRRPEDIAADREELRRLLRRGHSSGRAGQPITGATGAITWMLYSWNCSLTGPARPRGASVSLTSLRLFRGTQLATFGYTGVPLMAAVSCRETTAIRGSSSAKRERPMGPRARSRAGGQATAGRGDRRFAELRDLAPPGDNGAGRRRLRGRGRARARQLPFPGGLEWAMALGYRVDLCSRPGGFERAGPAFIPGHKGSEARFGPMNRCPTGSIRPSRRGA